MAVHYYDEDDIELDKVAGCNVVVNHVVELSEEEKKQARQEACLLYTSASCMLTEWVITRFFLHRPCRLLDGSAPVSYTHLDVYKRQGLILTLCLSQVLRVRLLTPSQ